ncbi:hypothetical protein LIA77_10566 [Sarocladium implicatum]|nr:hypothetical protein LIA77_10566 [Sarocladium implicatum]
MSESISSEAISKSDTRPNEVVDLDPRGDFVFVIRDENGKLVRKVRCFSQILKFTSPVLAKMLGPDYKEGIKLQAGGDVKITISEQYPEAMAQMLSVLHFRDDIVSFRCEPRSIAAVAVQADKYDCASCLRAWVAAASDRFLDQDCTDPLMIGHLVFAAFTCKAANLARIFQHAVISVTVPTPDEWDEDPIVSQLPPTVLGK